MIYEVDDETVNFLCKHKLNFNQFALCLLIYKKDVKNIIKISEEVGLIGDSFTVKDHVMVKDIDDLIERGFLLNHNLRSNEYELDNFVLTPKFTKGFLIDVQNPAQELWDNYPKKLFIQGMEVPAKACDFDVFEDKYLKGIKNSIKIHKEVVMPRVEAMKIKSPYAPMNIINFVGSRYWEDLDYDVRPKTRTY